MCKRFTLGRDVNREVKLKGENGLPGAGMYLSIANCRHDPCKQNGTKRDYQLVGVVDMWFLRRGGPGSRACVKIFVAENFSVDHQRRNLISNGFRLIATNGTG